MVSSPTRHHVFYQNIKCPLSRDRCEEGPNFYTGQKWEIGRNRMCLHKINWEIFRSMKVITDCSLHEPVAKPSIVRVIFWWLWPSFFTGVLCWPKKPSVGRENDQNHNQLHVQFTLWSKNNKSLSESCDLRTCLAHPGFSAHLQQALQCQVVVSLAFL
jgi:hypothetical protein